MDGKWKTVALLLLVAVGVGVCALRQPVPPEAAGVTQVLGNDGESGAVQAEVGAERNVEIRRESASILSDAENTGSALVVKVLLGAEEQPGVDVCVFFQEEVNPSAAPLTRRTDDLGQVRIEGLNPGRWHVYTDRAQRHATVALEAGREISLVYRLIDGCRLSGVVIDGRHEPVANAKVLLWDYGGNDCWELARTDAFGRFSVLQVATHVAISARANGHAPSPLYRILADRGAQIEMQIALPGAGGALVGRVVDKRGGGVAGAEVVIGRPAEGKGILLPGGLQGLSPRPAKASTDGKGTFRVEGLPLGSQPVSVSVEGYVPFIGEVEILEGAWTSWIATLESGFVCEGVVSDAEGAALSGVKISYGQQSVSTDAEGMYRLRGLPPGVVKLVARAKGLPPVQKTVQDRGEETVKCDFVLGAGVSIAGLVTDLHGEPVVRARVSASRGNWGRRTWSDASGQFEIAGAPEEKIRIGVECPGYRPLRGQEFDCGAVPVVLRMVYEGTPTGVVRGRLLFTGGASAVGTAWLERSEDGVSYGLQSIGIGGSIAMEGLRPGSYALIVRAQGFAPWKSKVFQLGVGASHDVGEIDLVKGSAVHFRVSLPDGDVEHRLIVYDEDGHEIWVVPGANPAPTALSAGRYHVIGDGASVVPAKVEFLVETGKSCTVPVVVRKGARTVIIVEAPGHIERLNASLRDSEGQTHKLRLEPARHGEFQCLLGLGKGNYSLDVSSVEGASGRTEFSVDSITQEVVVVRVWVQ